MEISLHTPPSEHAPGSPVVLPIGNFGRKLPCSSSSSGITAMEISPISMRLSFTHSRAGNELGRLPNGQEIGRSRQFTRGLRASVIPISSTPVSSLIPCPQPILAIRPCGSHNDGTTNLRTHGPSQRPWCYRTAGIKNFSHGRSATHMIRAGISLAIVFELCETRQISSGLRHVPAVK